MVEFGAGNLKNLLGDAYGGNTYYHFSEAEIEHVVKVGQQLASHHELEKIYGVSLITVKRALSELVNEKVLFSRMGKGTFVAEQEKTIDTSHLVTIGLVLKDLNNPFFSLNCFLILSNK